jgi:hypothetical protein
MNKALVGRVLFSDGPVDDERWLRITFNEAGLEPAFTIEKRHAMVMIVQFAASWGGTRPPAAKAEADVVSPTTHRAEADARHLAALWHIILRGPRHVHDSR